MDLSIVIVNYNTADLVNECLKSIYAQSYAYEIEVLVVDNASADNSVELIRRRFPLAQVIVNDRNLGFAAANNIGVRAASGRYVLLLNSDTELIDGSIDTLVRRMDGDTGITACCCKLLNSDGSTQKSIRSFPTPLSAFTDALLLTTIMSRRRLLRSMTIYDFDYETERDVCQPAGAFLLIRRDVYTEVGGLDETFFLYYEDVDFCRRIIERPGRIRFYPDVSVYHHSGGTFRKFSSAATGYRLISKTRYFARYYPFSLWFIKILILLELSLRSLLAIVFQQGHSRLSLREAVESVRATAKESWRIK